jgi:hypothetical protein
MGDPLPLEFDRLLAFNPGGLAIGPGFVLPAAGLLGTPQGLLTGGKLDVFAEKLVEANEDGTAGLMGAGVDTIGRPPAGPCTSAPNWAPRMSSIELNFELPRLHGLLVFGAFP